MPLREGTRVGVYELTGLLGIGGMGEVYRAHDRTLGRDVAIKILPEAFAHDPERVSRFQREAQILASLSHPQIAQVHGLESADGVKALVMECVEGPTLADRLAHGPMPLSEALPIARQIAAALEAAHERGIVHRDLKPANVKITGDDRVKVLDFGLARIVDPGEQLKAPAAATLTSPGMTQLGAILGTPAYMSPEQATGRPADKRTDIWSFGCLLYEMLTGIPAFGGGTISETLANVLKSDPDWTRLPAELPTTVRVCVERCLARDRHERLADMGTVAFLLSQPAGLSGPARPVSAGRVTRRGVAGLIALGLGLAVVAGALVWRLRPGEGGTTTTTRFQQGLPDGQTFALDAPVADVSPDGKAFVYATTRGLYLRRLDELNPQAIAGTTDDRCRFPVFSPDGQWIAYGTQTQEIRKISVAGGTPVTLAGLPDVPTGLHWQEQTLLTTVAAGEASGIYAVSQNGGAARRLIAVDPTVEDVFGAQLLDGTHLLYTVRDLEKPGAVGGSSIVLQSVDGGPRTTLVPSVSGPRGTAARVLPSGHLAYVSDGTLRVVPFDRQGRRVTGEPVAVLPGVSAAFSVSGDGTLIYQTPGAPPRRTLVWVDRGGKEEVIPVAPDAYFDVRLSPDGRQVAMSLSGDIWIWTIDRELLTNLTLTTGAVEYNPVWAPDGLSVLFDSSDGTARRILRKASNGIGAPIEVVGEGAGYPDAITPDGSFLVYHTQANAGMLQPLNPPGPARALWPGAGQAFNASFSPDGRWIAYQSNESGQFEVYVHPFPAMTSGRWQISTAGGTHPHWARSGGELLFIDGAGTLTSVPVDIAADFVIHRSVRLFPAGHYFVNVARDYDVSLDGSRFLFVKNLGESQARPSLTVVTRWFDELRRVLDTQ